MTVNLPTGGRPDSGKLVRKACAQCRVVFFADPRRKFCTPRCKAAAQRARQRERQRERKLEAREIAERGPEFPRPCRCEPAMFYVDEGLRRCLKCGRRWP